MYLQWLLFGAKATAQNVQNLHSQKVLIFHSNKPVGVLVILAV